MSETADIVQFPDRVEHRLRRAFMRLEEALQEQGQAVAGFRASMAALSAAVSGLDSSLKDYRGALDSAATRVDQARQAAIALEARAEMMIRRQ